MNTAYFNAPLSVGVPAQDGRRFAGILYSGGLITDHPTWEAVAFDLQTMKVATPIPLLFQHRHEQTVGVVRRATIGADIRIEGDLFTGIDEKAAEIAAKSDSGMAWQLSVGLFLGRVEEVAVGKSITLNGRLVRGPLAVLRNAIVREASVVAVGADRDTSMAVFVARKAVEQFSVPRGYSVRPEDLRRLEAATALAERSGVDFATAARMIERQQQGDGNAR
jgi:hypothetical protein